jgi:hypothetical protein
MFLFDIQPGIDEITYINKHRTPFKGYASDYLILTAESFVYFIEK